MAGLLVLLFPLSLSNVRPRAADEEAAAPAPAAHASSRRSLAGAVDLDVLCAAMSGRVIGEAASYGMPLEAR